MDRYIYISIVYPFRDIAILGERDLVFQKSEII